ncbi:uncharacterized protein VICG_00222 [Vittaforma corneae ATCC 50505]|uniref:Transcription factor CBF/NF-Y/archaeal histone domain-containing protein n=1 Tax=Vittaforma corneae (strain ATCC 50505) TaxID=993615 RepID=L2GRF0_VITCO|nr:uncharacterized protein VICG_00222 [Vittaforma corneae ATCC 50505]ELA42907.1 hypothetical protein VICG_00222 [Vittaforma corneae ATCC 50505]
MPPEKSDDDSELPRATVDSLIHDVTPKDYGVSKDVRELLKASARLFLSHIALEANRLCELENKKTIGTSHVFKSMEKCGFGDFVEECDVAAKNYDEYSRHKPSRQNKFKDSGKSMEELQKMQMELFRQAAEQQKKEYGIEDNSVSESNEK